MESHRLSKYEWVVHLFVFAWSSVYFKSLVTTNPWGFYVGWKKNQESISIGVWLVSNNTLRNWEASSNWAEQEWSLSVSFHTYRPCQDQQDSYSFFLSTYCVYHFLVAETVSIRPPSEEPQLHKISSYWVCPDISNLLASVTGTSDGAGWREAAWGVTMEIMFSRLAV